jgi:hypothetical protein
MFLDRKLDRRAVIYYDLETCPRLMKSRLSKMGAVPGHDLFMYWELAPLISPEGLDALWRQVDLK